MGSYVMLNAIAACTSIVMCHCKNLGNDESVHVVSDSLYTNFIKEIIKILCLRSLITESKVIYLFFFSNFDIQLQLT